MNVLIAGGSGLIGTAVRELLEKKGHRVAVLSREKSVNGVKTYCWNVEDRTIEDEAISFADAVINLSGTSIAGKRWTLNQKKSIINSRVQTTQLLVTATERLQKALLAFVSASAIGYYGNVTRTEAFVENDPPGSDFLGQTCELWEKSADLFKQLNIRTVKLRIGVVLAREGGMLPAVLPVFRNSFGTPLGSGKQYVPWIHVEDLARMFVFALERAELHGVYNAVAPNPVNNKTFTKALNASLGKKQIFPKVPGFLLKLLYGGSASLILEGSPVSAKKIMSEGFSFNYPILNDALNDLL